MNRDVELREAHEITRLVYPVIRQVRSTEIMLSIMGTMIDYWSAEHGLSAGEVDDALDSFIETAKAVHAMLGMPSDDDIRRC